MTPGFILGRLVLRGSISCGAVHIAIISHQDGVQLDACRLDDLLGCAYAAAAVAAAAPPPDLVVTDLVKLVNAGAALAYAIYHGGVEFALAMPPAVVAAYGRACRAYQIGRHAR